MFHNGQNTNSPEIYKKKNLQNKFQVVRKKNFLKNVMLCENEFKYDRPFYFFLFLHTNCVRMIAEREQQHKKWGCQTQKCLVCSRGIIYILIYDQCAHIYTRNTTKINHLYLHIFTKNVMHFMNTRSGMRITFLEDEKKKHMRT